MSTHPNSKAGVTQLIGSRERHQWAWLATAAARDGDLPASSVNLRLAFNMQPDVLGTDEVVTAWQALRYCYFQWVCP